MTRLLINRVIIVNNCTLLASDITPKTSSGVHKRENSDTSQLILLGAVFAILAFISDGTWGLLAGTARNWLATDSKRLERLRATGGIIMIVLGLGVLYSAIVSG